MTITLASRLVVFATLFLTSCNATWGGEAVTPAPPTGTILWKPGSFESEKWLMVLRASDTGKLVVYINTDHVYQYATSMSAMYEGNWLLEERVWEVYKDLPKAEIAARAGWRVPTQRFKFVLREFEYMPEPQPGVYPSQVLVYSDGNGGYLVVLWTLRPKAWARQMSLAATLTPAERANGNGTGSGVAND